MDRTPYIKVSWGEVFDKISILQIKKEKIASEDKLIFINKELDHLMTVVKDCNVNEETLFRITTKLRLVNEALWRIEDEKRDHEVRQTFDDKFVELARKVYILNDERASLKREINLLLNSDFLEVKAHGKQSK